MEQLKKNLNEDQFETLLGLKCPVDGCLEFIPGYLEEVQVHVKEVHNLKTSAKNDRPLQCFCGSIQNTFKLFKQHVTKHHPRSSGPARLEDEPEPMDIDEDFTPIPEKPTKEDTTNQLDRTKANLKSKAASFITKIRCDIGLPETKVQAFIDTTNDLIRDYQDFVLTVFDCFLDTEGINTEKESVKSFREDMSVRNLFYDVMTHDDNVSYLASMVSGEVPEPVELVLGTRTVKSKIRYQSVKGKTRVVVKTRRVNDAMHYIPVPKILALVLQNRSAREMIANESESQPGMYRGYKDGSNYKENDFLQCHPWAVRLVLHVDDVEYCNPLSSHQGVNDKNLLALTEADFDAMGFGIGPRAAIRSAIATLKYDQTAASQPIEGPSTSYAAHDIALNTKSKATTDVSTTTNYKQSRIYKMLEQDKKFRKILYNELDKKIEPENKKLCQMIRIICKPLTDEMFETKILPTLQVKEALAVELLETFPFLECTKVCENAPAYSLFFYKNGGKKRGEHTGMIQNHIRNASKDRDPEDKKFTRKTPEQQVESIPTEIWNKADMLATLEPVSSNYNTISTIMAELHVIHRMLLQEKKTVKGILSVLPHFMHFNGAMIQQAYARLKVNYNVDSDLKKVFGMGILAEMNFFSTVTDDHIRGCLRIMTVLTRKGQKSNQDDEEAGAEAALAAPLIRWVSSLEEQMARYAAYVAQHKQIMDPHLIFYNERYFLFVQGELIDCGESSVRAMDCLFKSFEVFRIKVPVTLQKLMDFVEIVAYKTSTHSSRATVNKWAKSFSQSLNATI